MATYLNCHRHAHQRVSNLLILMAEFFRYPQRKCTQAVGALTEHIQTFILLFQLLLRSVGTTIEARTRKRKMRTNVLRRHARMRHLHYHIRCNGSQFMVAQYYVAFLRNSLDCPAQTDTKFAACLAISTYPIHRGLYQRHLWLGQRPASFTEPTCPTT